MHHKELHMASKADPFTGKDNFKKGVPKSQ
jgi:hypothetical protein